MTTIESPCDWVSPSGCVCVKRAGHTGNHAPRRPISWRDLQVGSVPPENEDDAAFDRFGDAERNADA